MYRMDQSGNDSAEETMIESLDTLSKQGSSKKRLQADESIASISNVLDGFRWGAQTCRGVVRRHGAFAAPELTIDCFHFQVIDFGDSTPLTVALMRGAGDAENVDRNQWSICIWLPAYSGIWQKEARA